MQGFGLGFLFLFNCLLILGTATRAEAGPTERRVVAEKLVMGWLESVFLKPWNVRLTAKLDTGANTSSLHADQITHFIRDGKEWVRFGLKAGDEKSVVVERPVVRTAVIKERTARSTKREVVTMSLCKNGRDYETEFTLVDRSNFNYPILLGRSFLQGVALVDAAETFLYKAESDPCRTEAVGSPGQ